MIWAVTSWWKGSRGFYRRQLPKHFISHLKTESSKTLPSDHPLLGPPEIYLPGSSSTNHQLVGYSESLHDSSNKNLPPKPPIGFVRVSSSWFQSTGNPCLDFFMYVCPERNPFYLEHYLEMSWKHNPLTTLKIICFWRAARETGKPRRETFYRIALWLYRNHPKTLAYNLKTFTDFGYLKDMLEILHRVLGGPQVRKRMKSPLVPKRMKGKEGREPYKGIFRACNRREPENNSTTVEKDLSRMVKTHREKDVGIINKRRKRAISMAKDAVEMYYSNPNYQVLHNLVSVTFARLLRSDLELLKCGKISKISLAGKWCPSLNSSYDRSTLICESIARRIFPRDSDPEYKEIEEAHYAYRVRDRLRKQVLVPLREALKIPERCKCSDIRDIIDDNRVGYLARIKYKEQYLAKGGWPPLNYAEDRLWEGEPYQFPHCLVSLNYLNGYSSPRVVVMVEKQWHEMVERLVNKGKFGSCLAVCGNCRNCSFLPGDAIAALGLLVSDVAEEPWKHYIVTFNSGPELENFNYPPDSDADVDDISYMGTFHDRFTDLKSGHPKQTADFQKIAGLILQFAIDNKLSRDKMIKRLLVFWTENFDKAFGYDHRLAGGDGWERDYKIMRKKFREKGYVLPELVFWNLNGKSREYPMLTRNKKGVTILNGCSKVLMTYFLKGGGRMRPGDMMRWAISGKKYKDLVVLD